MENVIQITRADNQVIMYAYTGEISYELCNIQSGFTASVDVTIAVVPGNYTQVSPIYHGSGEPTECQTVVELPVGQYSLVAIGIEWGGGSEFAATLNGASIPFETNDSGSGIYYNLVPLPLYVFA